MPRMMHYLGQVPQMADVGGKARELDRMIKNGIHVPEGIVFDTESWLSDEWRDTLNEKLAFGEVFAVRSSALAEDTPEQSMAGMFISKTRVPKTSVGQAIEEVRAHARELHGKEIPIIVQTWIEGSVSGVAFSDHPTKSFASRTAVIDAAEGTAERIVSGEVTPHRAYAWNDGVVLVPRSFPLPAKQFSKLVALVRNVSTYFGKPVDIEWTAVHGTIYALQARPMTVIPKNDPLYIEEGRIMHEFAGRPRLMLDRGDYAETLPRPSRASFELLQAFYASNGPFARAARNLGLDFDESKVQHYFVTLFGWLFCDTSFEPIHVPTSFLKKISVSFRLQAAVAKFPAEFYSGDVLNASSTDIQSLLQELQTSHAFTHYAQAALLARVAQQQPLATQMFLQSFWKMRQEWLSKRPTTIPIQDFELAVDGSALIARRDWKMPTTYMDAYAILREDAKDELRSYFSALRNSYFESQPEYLVQNDFEGIQLPSNITWEDLFDLRSASLRHTPQNGTLHGTAVSSGAIEGTVLVIKEPRPVQTPSIIVVPSLTPDWFSYFTPNVIGVISETGSLLSHGAIQCRERNIPAIFGVIGACSAFQNDIRVRIDSKSGTITRI